MLQCLRHDHKLSKKKNTMLKMTLSVGELIEELTVLSRKMNSKLKVIARAAETAISKKDKDFVNTYLTEITNFAKNNMSLIKRPLQLTGFVNYLYEISFEVHDVYHAALNAHMKVKSV